MRRKRELTNAFEDLQLAKSCTLKVHQQSQVYLSIKSCVTVKLLTKYYVFIDNQNQSATYDEHAIL